MTCDKDDFVKSLTIYHRSVVTPLISMLIGEIGRLHCDLAIVTPRRRAVADRSQ